MNIRELIALTGVPERQVRYLIAEGFIPSPRGGRARAEYGEDHAAAIQRYGRLRELGFPPAAIRLLLQANVGVPFPVAEGLTLVVDPALIGSGANIEPLRRRMNELLENVLKDTSHAPDSSANRD